jgi:thiamine transport system ATP-binding protein
MLTVRDVTVTYDGVPALSAASLDVASGETLALVGPSGCGKTTLLRVIAGLEIPARGTISLDGGDLRNVPPHARRVGLMFQDNVLFPHRDVAANVAFGLRMAGRPREEITRRVADLLDLVGLPGTGRRSVQTLSGGEQQRIALARALAPSPRALLLDEPLGSLDGPLRERLLDDLRSLFDRLALTVLYVTHDVGEAFALGHRVAVMRAGRIVQIGSPDELWSAPAGTWVAHFLGMRNVVEDEGGLVVIHPEAIRVLPGKGAVVAAAERRGAVVWLRLLLDDGRELEAAAVAARHPAPGDAVAVEIDPAGVVPLPPEDRAP